MINLYTLLANPISGNGRSLRALPEIERVMKDFSLDYHVEYTREPGDATSIAEKAVQNKEDGIVVIGGDGTVFETLGGMAGSQTQLIYAPTGTGNDFVKALRLPLDAAKAVRQQLAARVRALDYALVNKTPFMNVCGTGFDVDVLRKLTAYKDRFQGIKAYLLALKDALGSYRPIDCEISVDGKPFEKKRLCILSIGNGQFIGGGMKAVPDVVPNDGLLDVVEVRAIRKWQIPFLLPLFILGKHTHLSIAKTCRCRHIEIHSDGMTFQLDGELRRMDSADVRIIPGGLLARY